MTRKKARKTSKLTQTKSLAKKENPIKERNPLKSFVLVRVSRVQAFNCRLAKFRAIKIVASTSAAPYLNKLGIIYTEMLSEIISTPISTSLRNSLIKD